MLENVEHETFSFPGTHLPRRSVGYVRRRICNADHWAIGEHVQHFCFERSSNGVAAQVRRSPKGSEDDYSFDVLAMKYATMFLFFTSSSSGPAPLTVRLAYEDGSTDTRNIIVPDWYQ
jgi:hypothetical protein